MTAETGVAMPGPRIALIHALEESVAPARAAFRRIGRKRGFSTCSTPRWPSIWQRPAGSTGR